MPDTKPSKRSFTLDAKIDPTPSAAKKKNLLIGLISSHAGRLTRSEQKVADMLDRNPDYFANSTMSAIAAAAGVSEPTIMRFCNSLGFSGFQSFRTALTQQLALGTPISYAAIGAGDSVSVLIKKIFDHTVTSLDLARRSLTASTVERAIEKLLAAQSITFIGLGASGIIAQDGAEKFALFGVPCSAPIDTHQQFIAAAMAGPETVFVAISNTGRTKSVIEVAKNARRNGAAIVSITGGVGPLVDESDVHILARTFENTDVHTPMVSRLAGLVIIDILATAVSGRRGSDHLQRIEVMKADLVSFARPIPHD